MKKNQLNSMKRKMEYMRNKEEKKVIIIVNDDIIISKI